MSIQPRRNFLLGVIASLTATITGSISCSRNASDPDDKPDPTDLPPDMESTQPIIWPHVLRAGDPSGRFITRVTVDGEDVTKWCYEVDTHHCTASCFQHTPEPEGRIIDDGHTAFTYTKVACHAIRVDFENGSHLMAFPPPWETADWSKQDYGPIRALREKGRLAYGTAHRHA